MLRQEAAIAGLRAQINQSLGGHATQADFMPWASDENQEASVNDVMSILTGGKRG